MKSHYKFTAETDQQIITLVKTNKKLPEIAVELNMSIYALQRRMKKLGLNKSNKKDAETINRIKELSKQNLNCSQIGKILNLSKNTINRISLKNNIPINFRNKASFHEKEIIKLYSNHGSVKEIAASLNLKEGVVRKFLRTHQIEGERERLFRERISKIKVLHDKGYVLNEICQITGYARRTILGYMKKANMIPNKNRLNIIDISELEPLSYYLNYKISDFKGQEEQKEFILKVIYAKILDKKEFVFRKEITDLPCGITNYYLGLYDISVPEINRVFGLFKGQSLFEQQVLFYLNTKGYRTECQKTFETCVSKHGNLLRFDFYLPDYNLLIEADGNQHYCEKSPWYNVRTCVYDSIKNK